MNVKNGFLNTRNAVSAVLLSMLFAPAVHAQGLSKAKGFLETLRDELTTIVPIVAVIAIILAGAAYWFNIVQKETFIKILVGLIIVGSAAQIVAIFMG